MLINQSRDEKTRTINNSFKLNELTDATFEREILLATEPVYVLFSSNTCQLCTEMENTIKQIGIAFNKRIKFYNIVIQENPIFSARYAQSALPLSIIFHKGEIVRDTRLLDGQSVWTGNAANLQYFLQWLNTVLNVINERF